MAAITAGLIGASLLGTAAGIYGANKAAKGQEAALNAQQSAQENDLAFRMKQYNDQKALYGPLEEQAVKDASGDGPLDYGLISGNINRNADAATRRIEANPNMASGLSASAARGIELGRAASLSGAYQQGLAARRQYRQAVLSGSGVRQAAVNVEAGNQAGAAYQGGIANMYGGAARDSWSGVTGGLGDLIRMSRDSYNPKGLVAAKPNFVGNPEAIDPNIDWNPNSGAVWGGGNGHDWNGTWEKV